MRWRRRESGLHIPTGPRLLRSWANPDIDLQGELDRAPAHVLENLGRGGPFEPRGSSQSWEETLYSPVVDGTAVTAAANTILLPDFNLPANYMTVGKTLRYTLYGRMSSAITTPGTWTFIEKWGGVGGVAMASSGAIAPDTAAASTAVGWRAEFLTVQRSIGTAGTSFTMGWFWHGDILVTTAGLATMITTATPVVATVDTTIVKALSATVTPSLGTGSIQTHLAVLEALN